MHKRTHNHPSRRDPSFDQHGRYEESRWQAGSHAQDPYGRTDQADGRRFGGDEGYRFNEDLDRGRFASGSGWDDSLQRSFGRGGGYGQGGYAQGGYGQGFDSPRYDQGGFNPGGFEDRGFAQRGFNHGGFDERGFNQRGFDRGGNPGGQDRARFDQQDQGRMWGQTAGQGFGGNQGLGQQQAAHGGAWNRGPKGYMRSDERIREDVCDRLAGSYLDASDVEVQVSSGEVTLTGTVPNRQTKYQIEETSDQVSGVRDVHNRLTIARAGQFEGAHMTESDKKGTSGKPHEDNGKRPNNTTTAH